MPNMSGSVEYRSGCYGGLKFSPLKMSSLAVHCASSTFPSSSQLKEVRMSGPVTIHDFSGSAEWIHAGAEKSRHLPFGPDPEAGV